MRIKIDNKFLNKLEKKLSLLGNYKFNERQLLVNYITEFLAYYCDKHEVTYVGYESIGLKETTEENKQVKLSAYREYVEKEISAIFARETERLLLDTLLKDLQQDYMSVDENQSIQTLFLLVAIKADLEDQGKEFQTYLRDSIIEVRYPTLLSQSRSEAAISAPVQNASSPAASSVLEPRAFMLPPYWGYMPYFQHQMPPHLIKEEQPMYELNQLEKTRDALKQEIAELKKILDGLRHETSIVISQKNTTHYSAHYEFSTAREMNQPKVLSFSHIVLQALVETTDEPLPNIQGKLDPSQNRVDYYRQFMSFILAEIKENVKRQEQAIAKKHLKPFHVQYTGQTDSTENPSDILARMSVTVKNKDLPKLDHGFFQELVMIVIPERRLPYSRGRRYPEQESYLSIYAIARADRHTEDDDNENEGEKIIKLEIVLAKDDLNQIHYRQLKEFEIHWLAGLIPSERMYLACQHMPRVAFENQYLLAQLPAWPEIHPAITPVPAVSALNPRQQNAVLQAANAEEGLYLLQGPPGTGKTTTAAALITQIVQQHPDKTMLVCTPSNQSLRELLSKVYALSPETSMALIGVGKNLPKALSHVYVHHYTYSLYQPLIELKREIQKDVAHRSIKELAEKACQIVNTIHQDLEKLVKFTRKGLELEKIRYFHQKIIVDILPLKHPFFEKFSTDDSEIDHTEMMNSLEKLINFLQKNAYIIEEYLTQRAQIVFATLVASGRPWLKKQRSDFDILIIDEAAQALIPEAIIPFKFSSKLCIQIGDPQQLPPTVVSKAAQEKGFQNSMMFTLMNLYEQPYQMLSIQYRMHADICRWISDEFYHSELETAESIASRTSLWEHKAHLSPRLKRPSLFFDISSGREERHGDELSASIKNLDEARAVVNVACYLLFVCHFKAEDIGVITFYAAQVVLIKQLFEEALQSRRVSRDNQKKYQKNVLINTVDGFQGGEKPITLISCVRTIKSVGFLNDERRLNVAFSRAKEGRYVFGHFKALNESNSRLPSLLQDIQSHGSVINYEELAPLVVMPTSRR